MSRALTEEERRKLKNTFFYQHHMFILSLKLLKAEVVCVWNPRREWAMVVRDRVKAEIRSLEAKPELLFEL